MPAKAETHIGESSAKVAQKTNRKASSRKLPNKWFLKSDGHVPIHGDVYVSNYKGFVTTNMCSEIIS